MRTSALSIASNVALRISGVGLVIPARRRDAASMSSIVTVSSGGVCAGAIGDSATGRRGELARRGRAKRVTVEFDLQANARLVIQVEQDVADRAPLDRFDQRGHRLGVAGGNRADFSGVEIALAAELARPFVAREREYAAPRRAIFLENDQRALVVEQQVDLFGQRGLQAPSTFR